MINRITNVDDSTSALPFAKPMLAEVCLCGGGSDRECSKCETPLCDTCDKGDWQDQCSLCSECKNEKENYFQEETNKYYEQEEKDLQFIKANFKKVNGSDKLFVLKFVELANSINWITSNACSEINGMSHQRYREVRKLIQEEIYNINRIVSNFC